ncbi:phage tail length tape measure family protein [Chitiniphilus shinanonensis]|uniref:phage tail length tape measure family protein n=1 Tax=Chitiniphilus shinanonensis TaxID=553088 RepID=UPI00306FB873
MDTHHNVSLRITANASEVKPAAQETKGQIAQVEAQANKANAALSAIANRPPAFASTEMSARQMQAALRGVPAQFTDIVTALQAGQPPMQVMLQQGGQLKDMFGGIGPAARALGGYVGGLIGPLTLTAGAVLGLAVAWAKGEAESSRHAQAVALNGYAAGATVSQLALLAEQVDAVSGTQAKAAEILDQLAAAGTVPVAVMGEVATAISSMSSAGADDVDKLVARFAKLGTDPVKGIAELNRAYNFLTPAIYEQIRALEQQGRSEEAVTLAMRTAATELRSRAAEVKASAGVMERAWNGVKSAAAEAWDSMLSIGREAPLEAQIAKQRQLIADLKANTQGPAVAVAMSLREAEQTLATLEQRQQKAATKAKEGQDRSREMAEFERQLAAVTTVQQRGIEQQKTLNQALTEYRQNLEKIRQSAPNSAALTPASIAAGEAAIREQYKRPPSRAETAGARAEQSLMQRFRDAEMESIAALERAQESEQSRLYKYRDEVARFLQNDPRARQMSLGQRDALLAQAGAADQAAQAYRQFVDAQAALQQSADAYAADVQRSNALLKGLQDEVTQLERQAETFGLSRTEIEQYTLAKQQATLADLRFAQANDQTNAALANQIYLLEQQVDIQQRKVAATDQLELKEGLAQAEAQADQVFERVRREGRETAQHLNRELASGVIDALKSGEDAGTRLADALESMFLDLVLRPTLEIAMSPVSQAISGWLGQLLGGSIGDLFGGGLGLDYSSAYSNSLDSVGGSYDWFPSAAGGYDIPAGVNPMTQLHEREMVLPAAYADVIRGLAATPQAVSAGAAAAPSVTVNVINQSGQQVGAQRGDTRFDGRGYVVDVILSDLRTNGPIRQGLQALPR